MSGPARPALRYYGGKFRLAPWVISHLPPHTCYVEPFGGSMSVMLRKKRSMIEVYNDLDEGVVNFFRVLREQPDALISAIRQTPHARREFEQSYEPADDPVERARRLYVRSWQAFGATGCRPGTTGWRFEKTANRGQRVVEDWRNVGHLEVVAERLAGITIECDEATALLGRFDARSTLFYVDPPYVKSTRSYGNGYAHELTDDDHRKLLDQLQDLEGMVVVSGYPSELYDQALASWRRVACEARQLKAGLATEVLWISPAADAAKRQGTLFDEVAP